MQNKWICLLVLSVMTSACNMFGGLDKPSGDEQLLSAAQADLDAGNYASARERYTALSDAKADVKISGLAFDTLAEQQIFSISDLISTLGSNRGGEATFTNLSQLIASRAKTSGAVRLTLQAQYSATGSIGEPKLRAFMQFLISTAMFNQVLATAVGADGVLTSSDFVDAANVADCKASSINTLCAPCTLTSGALTNSGVTEPSSIDSSTNWDTAASLNKLRIIASASANQLNILSPSGSSQGILKTMNDLNSKIALAGQLGSNAIVERCERQAILTTLFP